IQKRQTCPSLGARHLTSLTTSQRLDLLAARKWIGKDNKAKRFCLVCKFSDALFRSCGHERSKTHSFRQIFIWTRRHSKILKGLLLPHRFVRLSYPSTPSPAFR